MTDLEPPTDPEETGAIPTEVDTESTMTIPGTGSAGTEAELSSDRYTLGAKLGEGGMATVLAAEDSRLERTVAVKQMKFPLTRNPEARRRFVKEAKILAALAHPGTVSVFDLGGEDHAPFYAMERVRGKTLHELMLARTEDERRGREGITHFVDIFERVCLTIAYAHSKGVIHRDLKPANIMVDDDYGTVLVMDWGIAKHVTDEDSSPQPMAEEADQPADDRTRAGAVMGTPGYMSPEQMEATAAASFQTDVFALGVILYRILTGTKPFKGNTAEEMKRDISLHQPEPPVRLNKRVGRELSAICMKALEKEPERRYPTARELADDLRRFREFRPVSVVKPRRVDRLVYWVRRHKVMSAALGTLLAAVVVVGTLAGMRSYVESRMVDTVLGMVEESYERVQDLERRLAEMESRRAALPEGSTARRAADAEVSGLRAEVSTNQLLLRGRLGGVIGLTIDSPNPRALELARWQSIRLVEMMVEFENYPMARSLAQSSIEHYEGSNVFRLTESEIARIRELLAQAEAEMALGR